MMRIYAHCDRGMAGHVWPDGGALLDQPLLLIDAFATITDARARAQERGRDAKD